MQEQKIKEIQKLAYDIDPRIVLFDGYSQKETASYKGELLFWRQVVSMYGLFADCDRFQLKEKKNLFEILKRYDLIKNEQYDIVIKFWNDISELRKWFCHNNDISLYYTDIRQQKIKNYLNAAFVLSSNKPKRIEDIQIKDWDILTYNLDVRFQEYLEILKMGLLKWKDSSEGEELIEEWIVVYSNSLFSDKELIKNTLAEIANYYRINNNIRHISVSQLANGYYAQLEKSEINEKNFEDILRQVPYSLKGKKDIMHEVICEYIEFV